VIREQSGRHLIFLTLHHLITDGWSMGVILRDLAELYASRLDAREPLLPDAPIRYRDYAAWKNTLAVGVEGERARAYWRATLAGLRLEPLISDATASPEAGREQSALREFPLPHALSERLLRLARDCGVRTFPLLLTLLAGALHRLAGRRNLLIGAVTSDRVRPELEHLAGLLVSSLPLHIQLAQDVGFADLVGRVDHGVREGMEHQAAGLGTLLADLRVGAREEGADTFEIVATYEAADEQMAFGAFRLAGRAELDTVPAPRLPAKFALAVLFVEDRGRLALTFHRDAAQVSSRMVARLETEFCAVAAQAVDAPQASLALPPTLAVGRIRPPDPRSLVERFEWMAREQPDAPAIEDGRRITYGELDRWANGVAQALHDRIGVGPEAICAILSDRSASMIVAALGVLKAGGAYLPVAPDVPNPRIQTMLTQARCACLLVVDDATADRAVDLRPTPALDIRDLASRETPPRGGAPHPNRLCYVIFTSGSTGAPKGVAVEEASVVNLCDWWAESFELTPSSRVAVCSSVGFDAFTLETWPTLLHGGTLFIYRDDEREPGRLSRNFARDGVTRAFLATPLFDLLRETQAARLGPDIRFATGGDALVLSKPLELPVINLYGPTEATVAVTSEAMAEGHAPGPAPLGRPIDNARIYILGPDLCPLPAGAIGQIAIGGLPLARGYIGRPRETAEAFAPDPTKPGARMFLTGDLGRITGSDSIEFLGRCDEQVKIRGHRVEPGDIEAALRSHPHVGQAAVVVAGRNGARSLSAFVTPAAGQHPNPADVLDFLRTRLPEFMLPRNIQLIDALPLTGNGKIDRRALSALEPVEACAAPVGRRREIDELIAALWAQALGAPELGATDDFFALGGDSLAAMRLTAAVSAALGASLDLRLLFDHPSLRDYCTAAEACARRSASSVLRPPFRAMADAKSYPLTRTQETLYRQAVAAPRAPLFEIRLFLLISGTCPIARLQQAIGSLTARHGVLRSAYRLDADGVPAAHIVTAGRPIETQDLSHLEEEARLAAITTHLNAFIAAPLPINEYPPIRWRLLALEPGQAIASLKAHHLALDAWSVENLIADLQSALNDMPLSPPPLDFAAFANWQKTCLAQDAFSDQRAYWRQRLAQLPTLSRGTRVGEVRLGQRAIATSIWPARLAEDLGRAARRLQCTRFVLLVAGLARAIAAVSGCGAVAIAANVANRPGGFEGAIGLFSNTVLLLLDGSAASPPLEQLAQTRQTVIDALLNADLPFEIVRDDYEAATGHSGSDLLRHMFLYAPAARVEDETAPIRVSPLDLGQQGTAGLLVAAPFVFAFDEDSGDDARASINYSAGECDDSRARSLLEHWRAAVETLL
jgi:amino acid adenylation domain-containing protein